MNVYLLALHVFYFDHMNVKCYLFRIIANLVMYNNINIMFVLPPQDLRHGRSRTSPGDCPSTTEPTHSQ